jgi:cell division protein FtsL
MEEKKNPLKNVKVVVRPSPKALKVVLILVILFSMAALLTLRLVHNGIQEEIQNLKDEAADFEYANSELDRRLEDPESVENVQIIAQEELDMVDPDTILIDPQPAD